MGFAPTRKRRLSTAHEDTQFKLGQVPIDQITFHPKDRDDIPAVLYGLKHLYCDESARAKIFEILEKRLLPGIDLQRGRPGMPLWRIFGHGARISWYPAVMDRDRFGIS